MVHEQLSQLELLIARGRMHLEAVQDEVGKLALRLHAAQEGVAALGATLAAQELLLADLRAGLAVVAAPAPLSPPPRIEPLTHPPDEAASVGHKRPEAPPAAEYGAVMPPPVPAAHASGSPVPPAPPPEAPPTRRPTPPAAPPPPAPPQPAARHSTRQVQRGMRVEIVFDDGSAEVFMIVTAGEANLGQNRIADNSPLGSALLGATVGEERRFRVRNTGPEQRVIVRSIVE